MINIDHLSPSTRQTARLPNPYMKYSSITFVAVKRVNRILLNSRIPAMSAPIHLHHTIQVSAYIGRGLEMDPRLCAKTPILTSVPNVVDQLPRYGESVFSVHVLVIVV